MTLFSRHSPSRRRLLDLCLTTPLINTHDSYEAHGDRALWMNEPDAVRAVRTALHPIGYSSDTPPSGITLCTTPTPSCVLPCSLTLVMKEVRLGRGCAMQCRTRC